MLISLLKLCKDSCSHAKTKELAQQLKLPRDANQLHINSMLATQKHQKLK